MKSINKILLGISLSLFIVACSGDKKRKGVDYNKLKTELSLTPEQEKQYDAITTKYQKQQEQNYASAKAQGGEMDRVALGIKGEELRAKQALEMGKVLDSVQMEKFNQFVDANSRKRPRYNDELLSKIKTELILTDEQFAMLNAANNAFEKSFNDAHDVYHGNNDLAKEYWTKYDNQRKEALAKVFTPEQNAKFLKLVENVKFKSRK